MFQFWNLQNLNTALASLIYRSYRSDRSDRSDRSYRSDRSHRSERSGRSDRSERSDRSDRSDHIIFFKQHRTWSGRVLLFAEALYIYIYLYIYILYRYNIASPENNEYNICDPPCRVLAPCTDADHQFCTIIVSRARYANKSAEPLWARACRCFFLII